MLSRLFDAIYPPRCAACDALVRGGAFCAPCAETLLPIEPPLCPRCGMPYSAGVDHPCAACARREPPYAAARAAFQYGGALASAIARLKFAGRPDVARPLGALLGPPPACDLVVPVPLHRRRLARREYNQAALLAREAWPGARIDALALRRVRDTPPQSGLDARARRANLRGAFRTRLRRVAGRRVVLVDDVLTTGATVEACARALRRAGAREVHVVTLARVVP